MKTYHCRLLNPWMLLLAPWAFFLSLSSLMVVVVVQGSERPLGRGVVVPSFFGRRRRFPLGVVNDTTTAAAAATNSVVHSNKNNNMNAIELTSRRSCPTVLRPCSNSGEESSLTRDFMFCPDNESSLAGSFWNLKNEHCQLPDTNKEPQQQQQQQQSSVDLRLVRKQQERTLSRPALVPRHKLLLLRRRPRHHHTQRPSRRRRPVVVTSAEALRHEILNQRQTLSQVVVQVQAQNFTHAALWDHAVVKLIVQRGRQRSKPGHRCNTNNNSDDDDDQAILALALEGGGMRGAVSAGMAAALMCLGLSDAFDVIYGSSAGSVIGAYMVSRQLCMDVYVDILPAAKSNFVCLKRLWKSICLDVWHSTLLRATTANTTTTTATTTTTTTTTERGRQRQRRHYVQPGLNTSFILDGIMHPERGLRPLDLQAFWKNNQDQPLRIAATYAEKGRLIAHCFGGKDFDCVSTTQDGHRHGVYACLQASMHVPGAAGPPVQIIMNHDKNNNDDNNNGNQTTTRAFFDAFCCEPLPYRSAVAEGATHCLVLCSRPDGYQPKTKQSLYEKGIAPTYFKVHGEPELAKFFKMGGQQYIYAEDLLTLMQAQQDRSEHGVLVPPTTVLYGADANDADAKYLASHRDEWKRAHLLPIKVPVGTSELPTLENKRESVLESVRAGFAAVYDIFAPALGLDIDNLTGQEVAQIVFPDGEMADLPPESSSESLICGPPNGPSSLKKVGAKSARLWKILGDVERDSVRRVRRASEEYLGQVRKVLDSLPGMECESFTAFVDSIRKSHNLV